MCAFVYFRCSSICSHRVSGVIQVYPTSPEVETDKIVATGNNNRPFVISTSNKIKVLFVTSITAVTVASFLGFTARYEVVTGKGRLHPSVQSSNRSCVESSFYIAKQRLHKRHITQLLTIANHRNYINILMALM